MDIDGLGSRLDGVRYYDSLIINRYGGFIGTDIFNQCIKDMFWPWRSDEYIMKECCRKYAKKMKISVEEFVLIDGGGFSVVPTISTVSAIMQAVGIIREALRDNVTIYRLYERGSLDVVWKGHVKDYHNRDNELIALLQGKGIRSPVDERLMRSRMAELRNPYGATPR